MWHFWAKDGKLLFEGLEHNISAVLGGKEDDCAGVLRPEHLEKLIAADSETVVEIELKRIIIIRVIVMKK